MGCHMDPSPMHHLTALPVESAQGYNRYVLEYGRGNLDNMYPVADLVFDPLEIATDPAAVNLVALMANSTHVALRLQVSRSARMRFPA